jgi:hypothetical protein
VAVAGVVLQMVPVLLVMVAELEYMAKDLVVVVAYLNNPLLLSGQQGKVAQGQAVVREVYMVEVVHYPRFLVEVHQLVIMVLSVSYGALIAHFLQLIPQMYNTKPTIRKYYKEYL